MNILVIHNRYREPGGEDVVVAQETRLLERYGHRVILYNRSNDELDDLSFVERAGLISRIISASDSRLAVRQLLRDHKPSIVHVHNTFAMVSPAVYEICQEESVPIVQTLHNYRLLCPAATFYRNGHTCEECLTHGLLRSVRYGCYRESRAMSGMIALTLHTHRSRQTWNKKIDAYVAISNFVREKFIHAGFPAGKIYVKPNFVELEPERRQRAGDYALFLGRLSPEKGLLTLLDAWQLLPSAVPLVIAGDGPMRQQLENETRKKHLDCVHFAGRVNRKEAYDAIQRAAFLIVPSVWFEPFGLVIAEAFAFGTPVIGAVVGAIQEMVEDQITGLHFQAGNAEELANKVVWAWNNPRAMEFMGEAARAVYDERYSPGVNYNSLMNIYASAIDTHTGLKRDRAFAAA